MPHSDPDVLALIALGEQAPPADAEHVAGCVDCRREVAALGRVVSTFRSEPVPVAAAVPAGAAAALAEETGPPVPPPPRVWDAIAAQTGVTVAPRPERVAGAPLTDRRRHRTAPARGSRPSLPSIPRSGRWTLGLAVAAALLVGAVAGSVGTHLLGRQQPSEPRATQVLAQVDLANLKPSLGATGHAVVIETAAGPRLKVDVSQLAPQPGHFYEVWLIDKQIKKMVPVGILVPGDDEFVIPQSVDISQYPIVDISVQQPGDPRHSGDSVLRGTIAG